MDTFKTLSKETIELNMTEEGIVDLYSSLQIIQNYKALLILLLDKKEKEIIERLEGLKKRNLEDLDFEANSKFTLARKKVDKICKVPIVIPGFLMDTWKSLDFNLVTITNKILKDKFQNPLYITWEITKEWLDTYINQ